SPSAAPAEPPRTRDRAPARSHPRDRARRHAPQPALGAGPLEPPERSRLLLAQLERAGSLPSLRRPRLPLVGLLRGQRLLLDALLGRHLLVVRSLLAPLGLSARGPLVVARSGRSDDRLRVYRRGLLPVRRLRRRRGHAARPDASRR